MYVKTMKKCYRGGVPPRKGEKTIVHVYYCYDTDDYSPLQCCSSPLIPWFASNNKDRDNNKDQNKESDWS